MLDMKVSEKDVINAFSVASTLLKTGLECWQRIVPLNAQNMNWSPGDIKNNFPFLKIEVWLVYNLVFISAIQQSDSILYTHTHTHTLTHVPFDILFHYVLSQNTEYASLKHNILKTLENIKTTEIQILQLDKKKREREKERKEEPFKNLICGRYWLYFLCVKSQLLKLALLEFRGLFPTPNLNEWGVESVRLWS